MAMHAEPSLVAIYSVIFPQFFAIIWRAKELVAVNKTNLVCVYIVKTQLYVLVV